MAGRGGTGEHRANFSPEEANRAALQAHEGGKSGRDPLFALQRAVISKVRGGPETQRELVAALLERADPLLLSSFDLLGIAMGSGSEALKEHALWFEGRLVPPTDLFHHELRLALRLAECRDGLPCATDMEILYACSGRNVCEDDRETFMLERWRDFGAPEESVPRVLALAARIRSAIDRRDVSVFVAPN